MSDVKDVVCGMAVELGPDTIRTTYESHEYYFCSEQCRKTFEANPEDYFEPEKHEPPYTVTGKIASPRFGSAGSGGLENEPVPERHLPK